MYFSPPSLPSPFLPPPKTDRQAKAIFLYSWKIFGFLPYDFFSIHTQTTIPIEDFIRKGTHIAQRYGNQAPPGRHAALKREKEAMDWILELQSSPLLSHTFSRLYTIFSPSFFHPLNLKQKGTKRPLAPVLTLHMYIKRETERDRESHSHNREQKKTKKWKRGNNSFTIFTTTPNLSPSSSPSFLPFEFSSFKNPSSVSFFSISPIHTAFIL